MSEWILNTLLGVLAALAVSAALAWLISYRLEKKKTVWKFRREALDTRNALRRLRSRAEPGSSIRERVEHLASRVEQIEASPAERKKLRGLSLEQLGRYSFETEDYVKAAQHFTQGVKEDPTLVDSWHFLAGSLAYLSRKDQSSRDSLLSKAIEAMNKAIALEPKRARLHMGHGWILDEMGKFDDAVGAYNRALALSAGLHEATYNKACALAKAGKLDEAMNALESVAHVRPVIEEARTDEDLALTLGENVQYRQRFRKLVGQGREESEESSQMDLP